MRQVDFADALLVLRCLRCGESVDTPLQPDLYPSAGALCESCARSGRRQEGPGAAAEPAIVAETEVLRCIRCGDMADEHGDLTRRGKVALCKSCARAGRRKTDAAAQPFAVSRTGSSAESPLPLVLAFSAILLCAALWMGRSGATATPGPVAAEGPATMGVLPAATVAAAEGVTPEDDEAVIPAAPHVELRTDEAGVLTQVAGPDPQSVLEAFRAHPSHLTRYAIHSIVPGILQERIGLVLDRDAGLLVKGVVIERDPRTRRWTIGNGHDPIHVLDNPPVQQLVAR